LIIFKLDSDLLHKHIHIQILILIPKDIFTCRGGGFITRVLKDQIFSLHYENRLYLLIKALNPMNPINPMNLLN
jgi:hypothetical protein